jgi:hypothetical protein
VRAFLIRLYPPRWRARYGDEFLAILEERPLGPFDAADILLGAFDAQLRLRGVGAQPSTRKGITMSLRLGGLAAIIGAPLWTAAFVIINKGFDSFDVRGPAVMLVVGSLGLLVALAGLSAFQARVAPALSWAAFALPALGTVAVAIGTVGLVFGTADFWGAFFLGLIAFFVGSSMFAIATYRTGVLSRRAALLLAIAPIPLIVGGSGGGVRDVLILAGLACFTLGWMALGVLAVRLDRPAAEPRPA